MKLIGTYTSPYVRKISVLLLEKGIAFEFVNQSPWLEESQVTDYTPLGKVPALVTDAGATWYNSSIIAAWLELHHPNPAFLPADPHLALAVRQLETLADGVCDAALLIVREQQKAPGQRCTDEMQRQRDKIRRGLDALEAAAVEGKGLNGAQITLADIATVCTLGYLNFRRVAPSWCVDRPQLVALATTLFQRDSFARTEPPAG
ncbi:glutathione S-transferase [Erwinia tasmaniensis]|uniref:Glutathione S-transferase YibF n=1 Tax=Erwinia tasmaniensis (strain DSM 17950 / CFBP 7177 / CIP 109463 / NCPPB 4357 / Et1/99) TaxID=465817 RepID=B2VCF9_ERWT9|nr:glutathione S-transferase [Erwinia tasmaniensis]CAO98480.1 Putative glutathione S-transferase YibF [Erwinia tasmaniensis Et1/99]